MVYVTSAFSLASSSVNELLFPVTCVKEVFDYNPFFSNCCWLFQGGIVKIFSAVFESWQKNSFSCSSQTIQTDLLSLDLIYCSSESKTGRTILSPSCFFVRIKIDAKIIKFCRSIYLQMFCNWKSAQKCCLKNPPSMNQHSKRTFNSIMQLKL